MYDEALNTGMLQKGKIYDIRNGHIALAWRQKKLGYECKDPKFIVETENVGVDVCVSLSTCICK